MQLTTLVGVAGFLHLMATANRLLLDALHARRYPLCAVGYKRTREHLLSWPAVLPPALREAKLLVSKHGQEQPFSPHSGTWLFLYENIPQLRYHNPSVQFLFEAHHDPQSQLLFTMEDGSTKSIITTGLRQREIRTLVQNFIEEK